ncbi:MAG: glucosaminidase domain-containing protein [Proteobacteria bacterium]|nr:glucosaminidase domain-containing protein [Pseudomonadota bacterium]
MDETIEPLFEPSQALLGDEKKEPVPCVEPIRFGNIEVDGLNVQACLAVTLCAFLILISVLRFSPADYFMQQNIQAVNQPQYIDVGSGEELVQSLKENGLWEIDEQDRVPPVIFSGFPESINNLHIEVKKKSFLHAMVPAALIALAEIENEKKALQSILARFPQGFKELVFSDDFAVWGRVLTMDEIEFVLMLTRKYRTNRAAELHKRIDLIPISLILAQGAIESSWGTSRFAQLGNNLFGIWTWGEKGIVPAGRDDGKQHKIATYDTIIDSIRAYIIMINRLPAYRNFREIRSKTSNPMKLADGLLYYSERRDAYVWEVKNLIRYNKLTAYDALTLADAPETPVMMKSSFILARYGKKAV